MTSTGIQELERMTREDVRAIAPRALAIVPLASTEQHGGHLPLGTDTFILDSVLRVAFGHVADLPLVVLPTLRVGSSQHHLAYPGTLSLTTETYLAVLKEILRSLASAGFRRAFLINGHGGNHEIAELAARDVALVQPIDVAAASWWVIAREVLTGAQAPVVGHAGLLETAILWATHPDLLRTPLPAHHPSIELFPPVVGTRVERHGFWTDIDGVTDSPDAADPGRGSTWLEVSGQAVADGIRAFEAFSRPGL